MSINEITVNRFFEHKKFLESRNKTLLDFMYSTACRVSELCEVKISDIDFDEDYIKLTGKGSKQRLVPIGAELKINLLEYIKLRNNFVKKDISYLFISKNRNKLERTSVYRVVKNIAINNNVKNNVHPHTLRHMLQHIC